MINLLSTTSRVEAPFIILTIGGYTFGRYNKTTANVVDDEGIKQKYIETFPNVINSLEVDKVNGTVNTYTIGLVYAITAGSDPNKIDKVFSYISKDRKIKISYGDYSTPQFIYKEEEALITKVTSNVNVSSSTISYTITAVSSAVLTTSGVYSFPKRFDKPSNVIKELLYNNSYGLLDVFYGMRDKQLVQQLGLIMSDDRSVLIEAKRNINVFDYLDYLVSCMTCIGDPNNSLVDQTKYIFGVFDETTGRLPGPYFSITRVEKSSNNLDNNLIYEIDVGYPTANIVTNFSIQSNDGYTLLYDYYKEKERDPFSYRINDSGDLESTYSPNLIKNDLYRATQSDINWWSKVTQHPISAVITLKGLLRPAVLMSYVRLNVYFYGRKHDSSGLYIITKQTDNVSVSGFRTTLSLTRIEGDSDYQ